jgi:serine/threonine-protein kinase
MGFVVAARHKLIGQRVAIKLVNSAFLDDADALTRFKREARALVAVQSENVVRVLDYGALPDGSPYLVMELLHGRDLLAELRARGPLPLGEAAEILLQACEGLEAVHGAGIVHRDVKPANLFLTSRASGRLLVKIVDFGISKTRAATEEELSLTRGSIGSPHYMSPEQLRSPRDVDARSDVWSLGVTLYRTLTGELPFMGTTAGSLLAAVMTDEPRALREVRPDLPAEVGEIIARCLARNLEDRYPNVSELAAALAPLAIAPPRGLYGASAQLGDSSSPDPSPSGHDSTARAHVSSVSKHGDAQNRDPRRALAAAIGVPILAVAAALSFTFHRPAPHAPVAATRPANAARVVVITDAPLPKTTVAEAAASYEAGLQAVRDASLVLAADRFMHAAALDPTMAAAELRSAIYGAWITDAETRKHGRAAIALRSSLTERDRDLLTALEPLYLSPHPDTVEAARRFDTLLAARPGDTEIQFVSAWSLFTRIAPAALVEKCDQILALDPRFAAAAWLSALASDGDALALREVDRCLGIAPSAASCLRVRAMVEETTGDCAGLEADAQRMVAIEGAGRRAYEFLAMALFARGRPLDSVREALRLKWKASPEPVRAALQAADEAKLALASGDFVTAQRKADELGSIAEQRESEAARREATLLQIDLHTELGEPLEAARIADTVLKRMGAWSGSNDIADDPRPRLYAAAVRGGLRGADEAVAARHEWESTWTDLIEPFDRGRIWTEGYAAPAVTPDEAEVALTALPRFEPLPALAFGGWTVPQRAKILALTGRFAEALPALKAVTASCRALQEPAESVQTRLWLGQALEKSGDHDGACGAYREVIDRWGREKRSVTAMAASARSKALGCAAR